MEADRNPAHGLRARCALALGMFIGLFALAGAATTAYEYDALGRLRRVVHDNGIVTDYALDAAGNRTRVDDLEPVMPSAPPSISVPAGALGNYTISWSAASGTVLRYELEESPNAAFVPASQVYSGSALSALITGRPIGTYYYYRVRACGVSGCSAHTAGANPIAVSVLPPAPAAPTNLVASYIADCVWRASWSAVVGAANYMLMSTNGTLQVVTATETTVVCPINNPNANKPKSVQACATGGSCSERVNF